MRLLPIALLLVTLAGLVPSQAFAAPTEVVLWHAYRAQEKRALEAVVKTYNKQQQAIRVKLLKIPYDAYADKISAAIPRGHGPDLFIFAHDRIGDWARNGILEKINFWVNRKLLKRFIPKTVRTLVYKRGLYGLPLAFKSLALFYNKDLIKQPPKTTKELLQLAKTHTARKKNRYGLAYQMTDFYYHAPWLHGFGGRVFQKGSLTIASKASAQALAFARSLKQTHQILPAEPTSHLISSLFNQGKAAMVINGPWFRGEINKKINYGVAPLPTVTATGKAAAPFLTSEAILLSKYSKKKRIAFKVMVALTSMKSALVRMTVGQQSVANVKCYSTPAAKKDPILQAFYRQMKDAVPMANTPQMRVVWAPMLTALGKTFRNQSTPAKALQEARKEIMAYIKRLKK